MNDALNEIVNAVNNAITQMIQYLPRLIGAIVIVLFGYLVGLMAKKATVIIVNKSLEKPLETTRIGKSLKKSGIDLGGLIGTLIMILIIVLSIVAAIDVLKLTGNIGVLASNIAIAVLNITAGITILAIGIPLSLIFAEYIARFFGGAFREKHELAVSLIYDVSALVLTVFVISLAVYVMFHYTQLLDYLVVSAPGFIAATITLFIGYVIGDSVGKIVNKIIDSIVEKPLKSTDIGRAISEMNIDLSNLIGGLTKAFVIVVSIVAAVEFVNIGGITGDLIYQIAIYLPRLIGGITLLTLGLILSIALAKYVGKFLHAVFKEKYSSLASLGENLILLGLVTVILTISLNIMMLEGSLVYPLIMGILIIITGIYVAGTVGSLLSQSYPTFKRLVPFIESIVIILFVIIGASGIFSQFTNTISVITILAWGISMAFALMLIPIIFYYTRLAWREASREQGEKSSEHK